MASSLLITVFSVTDAFLAKSITRARGSEISDWISSQSVTDGSKSASRSSRITLNTSFGLAIFCSSALVGIFLFLKKIFRVKILPKRSILMYRYPSFDRRSTTCSASPLWRITTVIAAAKPNIARLGIVRKPSIALLASIFFILLFTVFTDRSSTDAMEL